MFATTQWASKALATTARRSGSRPDARTGRRSSPGAGPSSFKETTMAHERTLNLNVGINSTGYLGPAWRARKVGNRLDFVDPDYYIRLSEIARRGVFDAVFFSDH